MRVVLIFMFMLQIILSGCASVNVYNQTDMFIDIEADKEDTWLGCSDIDSKAGNSLMTFYLLADDITHEFLFRRMISVERCLGLEKGYRALIESASKMRIVGLHPSNDNDVLITPRVPQKFKNSRVNKTWTFIRFSTPKACESYFIDDCKLENYWGGTLPPKESKKTPSS